ncbi:hypothetical protein CFP56_036579 [Quercus suber]|uniref:Uncharacterized protein n=1 Tax=Quercus suber TaxID=58331 RepID=A0AAW0J6G5_QUESU
MRTISTRSYALKATEFLDPENVYFIGQNADDSDTVWSTVNSVLGWVSLRTCLLCGLGIGYQIFLRLNGEVQFGPDWHNQDVV